MDDLDLVHTCIVTLSLEPPHTLIANGLSNAFLCSHAPSLVTDWFASSDELQAKNFSMDVMFDQKVIAVRFSTRLSGYANKCPPLSLTASW